MIGFWTRDVVSELPGRAPYTACAPLPRVTRACTWPALLSSAVEATEVHAAVTDDGAGSAGARKRPRVSTTAAVPTEAPRAPSWCAVPNVCPAWERLPEPRQAPQAEARAGTTPTVAEDAWDGWGLVVPDERNNHYFVRSMDEFLFDHLQLQEASVPAR